MFAPPPSPSTPARGAAPPRPGRGRRRRQAARQLLHRHHRAAHLHLLAAGARAFARCDDGADRRGGAPVPRGAAIVGGHPSGDRGRRAGRGAPWRARAAEGGRGGGRQGARGRAPPSSSSPARCFSIAGSCAFSPPSPTSAATAVEVVERGAAQSAPKRRVERAVTATARDAGGRARAVGDRARARAHATSGGRKAVARRSHLLRRAFAILCTSRVGRVVRSAVRPTRPRAACERSNAPAARRTSWPPTEGARGGGGGGARGAARRRRRGQSGGGGARARRPGRRRGAGGRGEAPAGRRGRGGSRPRA